MNEMFELEGASLTVHLPGDVDHPVSDEIRRESDRIMSTYTSGPCCLIFRIQDLWIALASDF